MACFTACVAEALIAYGVKKTVESKEKAAGIEHNSSCLSYKLSKLVQMLMGGSFLLLIEHVWHGEIVPFYPFLTAMNDPEDTKEMLYEIVTVGGSMDLFLTAVWAVTYFVFYRAKKEVNA
ncbi:MAG: hypothetical protein ACI4UM_03580 [Succinivibrio sp.]